MWILILILVIACLVFLLLNPAIGLKGEKRHGGIVHFFARGLDAGFKFAQIRMLWKASTLAGLAEPGNIYWSLDELDRCLKLLIEKYELLKENKPNHPVNELIQKMFEYRKKVEFNKPKYKAGIKTTRDIPINQNIKIRDNQVGVYNSSIISNTDTYLVIEYPKGDPLPIGFTWRKKVLNVYFWRQGDAGYFFESRLVENYQDHENHKQLRMKHSDYLLRSQKRKSVRAECNFPAQLYRLKSSQHFSNFFENNPGIYCRVIDISEDGLALRVSGRAKRNMPVKVQFNINECKVVMNGIVRHYRYEKGKDQSQIHIEAIPPTEKAKLAILAYVYDVDRSRYKKQKEEEEKANQHIKERVEDPAEIPELLEELDSADDSHKSVEESENLTENDIEEPDEVEEI